VGYHSAYFLSQEDGCLIVAILEWDGCVTNPQGLDIPKLDQFRRETGSIRNFPGGTTVASDAFWDVECDILIPAAMENQITLANCDRIRTKVLAEAANGPTTPGAGDALHKRGIMIIPDIFLNAGGVTVSYFEWGKDLSHMRFGSLQKHLEEIRNQRLVSAMERITGKEIPEADKRIFTHGPEEVDLVNSGLEEIMIRAYRSMREMHLTRAPQESMRVAAFMIAIEKVATSYEQLGIFP
jgi:glutamate dehydrogenase (NAD(P)+)